jgi:RNA polymerase sigma factor (sigma-70 family)
MADAAGFEAFYRRNLPRIVRACALVTLDRSRAEDLAAEAFIRLWANWGRIGSEDHAGGFVFKTAMRLCLRDRSIRRRPLPTAMEPADGFERALDRADVAQALAGLSVRQRQVVAMRDWAGFETSEVAEVLGMRESTVRVQLARARERLRAKLRVDEGSQA